MPTTKKKCADDVKTKKKKRKKTEIILKVGDFNSKVGESKRSDLGRFGPGKPNERENFPNSANQTHS